MRGVPGVRRAAVIGPAFAARAIGWPCGPTGLVALLPIRCLALWLALRPTPRPISSRPTRWAARARGRIGCRVCAWGLSFCAHTGFANGRGALACAAGRVLRFTFGGAARLHDGLAAVQFGDGGSAVFFGHFTRGLAVQIKAVR